MYCARCGSQVQDLSAKCPACGKPASGAPVPTGGGGSQAAIAAVVVASVLVVVAIIGIIAAIAIPNLLNAINRGRQKRTMADMRSVAVVVEGYAVDNGHYPAAATLEELALLVQPKYTTSLRKVDAWQHTLRYACWQSGQGTNGCDTYRLVSAGQDGSFEQPDPRDYGDSGERTTDFKRDIVYGNGGFLQYPEGFGAN